MLNFLFVCIKIIAFTSLKWPIVKWKISWNYKKTHFGPPSLFTNELMFESLPKRICIHIHHSAVILGGGSNFCGQHSKSIMWMYVCFTYATSFNLGFVPMFWNGSNLPHVDKCNFALSLMQTKKVVEWRSPIKATTLVGITHTYLGTKRLVLCALEYTIFPIWKIP